MRGKYVVKEVLLASFITASVIIASVCTQYIYVYFCMNQKMTIQHISRIFVGRVLPLRIDAVGVFSSPRRQGNILKGCLFFMFYLPMSSIKYWFIDDEAIFQDNNASCHKAKRIKTFLQRSQTKPVAQRECPRGVMVKKLDCGILSEFELHSCYFVHSLTNTFGKGMNSLTFLATG